MTREEYQINFNNLIKEVSELLEATGNDVLKKIIKKKLFDFSDKINGERDDRQNNSVF